MRILITGTTGDAMPPPYGGIPKVSLLYAREWRRMGHDAAVTFVYEPEQADDMGAGAEYFFEYSSKPTKLRKAYFLVRQALSHPVLYASLLRSYLSVDPRITTEAILYAAHGVFIDGILRRFKPDVILAQAALIKTFMASEVARMRGIPVVYNTYAEVHDQNMGVNKHLDQAAQRRYWTYFLNMSAFVIGMDNCSVGPLMYMPKEHVKVFYDTCDFDAYQRPSSPRDELRVRFRFPSGRFVVGMVGAFHHRKGHDYLIRAVAELSRSGLDVGAAICGGSGDPQKWIDLAKTEGIADRIYIFRNFNQEQLCDLHHAVDAYANLSNSPRSCGLDLALLEAMASGLPVVVCDNGALPHAVPNGENGFVVKTDDVDSIVGGIRNLVELRRERREEMGEVSRRIAEACDITKTAAIKIGWFEDLLRVRR